MSARPRDSRRLALGALAASLALASCRGGDAAADGDATQAVVNARTVIVAARSFTEMLGAIGTVTGRAGHVASLAAPAQARIAQVAVAVGQPVRAGTPLVTFDQTTFAAARQAAEAALVNAQRSHERTRRLVDEGIAPRKDLDQATADLAQAQANAETARRQEALSVLRSPITGVVTRVAATIGAMADPVQPLVEIADPSALDIIFNVTPSDAARIHRGAMIELSAGQSAGGEALGTATVVDLSAAVDTLTRSVAVRAEATATRRTLRIGETVFGNIAIATHPGAIVVPVEALVPEGEAEKVFVVDTAGVAHARAVTVGGRTDTVAEITDGLRAGERIVTYGAYGVDDGAKVIPLGAPGAGAAAAPATPAP